MVHPLRQPRLNAYSYCKWESPIHGPGAVALLVERKRKTKAMLCPCSSFNAPIAVIL